MQQQKIPNKEELPLMVQAQQKVKVAESAQDAGIQENYCDDWVCNICQKEFPTYEQALQHERQCKVTVEHIHRRSILNSSSDPQRNTVGMAIPQLQSQQPTNIAPMQVIRYNGNVPTGASLRPAIKVFGRPYPFGQGAQPHATLYDTQNLHRHEERGKSSFHEQTNAPVYQDAPVQSRSGNLMVSKSPYYNQPENIAPRPVSIADDVFIMTSIGWSCKHCHTLPLRYRAPNAVWKLQGSPPDDFVESHLSLCSGRHFFQLPSNSQQTSELPYPAPAYTQTSSKQIPMPQQALARTSFLPPERSNDSRLHDSSPTACKTFNDISLIDYNSALRNVMEPADGDLSPIRPGDRQLITDYFFYLMTQLEAIPFTEVDRKARKRESIQLGFMGLQCRHCSDIHTGKGRKFFWSSVDRLANSFAEIPTHIMKCKKCPDVVKSTMATLKRQHATQMARLPRGSQKVFLRRMWRRIHGEEEAHQLPKPAPEIKRSFQLLSISDDKDWLSNKDCLTRQQIEVVTTDEYSGKVNEVITDGGRIALRCVHCSANDTSAGEKWLVLPSSTDEIFEAVKDYHKNHLQVCSALPRKVEQSFRNEENFKVSSLYSVAKKYCALSAKTMGMVDTKSGLRMCLAASITQHHSSSPTAPLDMLANLASTGEKSQEISPNSQSSASKKEEETRTGDIGDLATNVKQVNEEINEEKV